MYTTGITEYSMFTAGAQAVLKYTLKLIPGSPRPGDRPVPVIKLQNKVYESTWQRAARKVKIVNMFKRMGQERMWRRQSDDSKLSSSEVSTSHCHISLKALAGINCFTMPQALPFMCAVSSVYIFVFKVYFHVAHLYHKCNS